MSEIETMDKSPQGLRSKLLVGHSEGRFTGRSCCLFPELVDRDPMPRLGEIGYRSRNK
jgi:hypothetical protein